MADRLFGAALADFITAFGEAGFIYEDDEGTPTVTTREGRVLLVPTPADTEGDPLITVKVFDAIDGTQLDELYDSTGAEVSELTIPTAWLNLGQILQFTVRDTETQSPPAGDVWLTTNEETGPWARAMPFTAELFTRLAAAEETLADLTTGDLTDFDLTDRADGKYVKFDNATGKNVYADPAGSGTVTGVNGQEPVDGEVTLGADDVGAATAADMAVVKSKGLIMLMYTGTGYPAKPSGFDLAVRSGPTFPTEQRAAGDVFLQWEQEAP